MLRMRELVDGEPDVEYSPTFRLWDLLAPNESEGSMSQWWTTLLRKIP